MVKHIAAAGVVASALFCHILHGADTEKDPVVAKYQAKLEYAKKQYLAAVEKIKQAMVKDYKKLRDAAMAKKDLALANKYQAKIDALSAKASEADASDDKPAATPDVDLDVGIPTNPDASPEGGWKSLDNGAFAVEDGITRLSQKKKGNPGIVCLAKNLGSSYTVSGSFRVPVGGHFSFTVCDQKDAFVQLIPAKERTMLLVLSKGGEKRKKKLAFVDFKWGDLSDWQEFTISKRGSRLTLTVGKTKASVKLNNYKKPYFGVIANSKSIIELRNLKVSK